MADKIYFRVNPLYTKHVLKTVEHYFSHITVRKKQNWPNLAGGGTPTLVKTELWAVFFLKASLNYYAINKNNIHNN